MHPMSRLQRLPAHRACLLAVAAVTAVSVSALAQSPWAKPTGPNERMVSLIAQDFSDCTNTTVSDDPNRTRGGEITVRRRPDGTTHVQVAVTVTSNATYHFYLKCVRQLGDVRTDSEGIGLASFDFQTSSVGATFAFDMYPEGAPAGNKFQSLTVSFQ